MFSAHARKDRRREERKRKRKEKKIVSEGEGERGRAIKNQEELKETQNQNHRQTRPVIVVGIILATASFCGGVKQINVLGTLKRTYLVKLDCD